MAKRGAGRTFQSSTEVTLNLPRSQVWDLIEPPTERFYDHQVRAGRLPGTPRGVGEIQYFLHEVGQSKFLLGIEIIELEEGVRALARSLTEPSSVVETLLIDAGFGFTILRHTVTSTVPERLSRKQAKLYQLSLDEWAKATSQGMQRLYAGHTSTQHGEDPAARR